MNETLIGTVSTLYPLKVQLIPDDTELPVVATTALNGIVLGSRIVLQKFGNVLIGVAVIADDSFIRCMIEKSSVQAIPSGSVTKVTFGAADVKYDPLSMFSDANDSIIVPSAGWYDITVGGRYATNISNGRIIYLYIDGAQFIGTLSGQDGAGRWGNVFSVKAELNVDSYIQMYTYQASGGNLNFGGAAPSSTVLSVIKI